MAGERPNFTEIAKDISTALADGVLLPEEERAIFDEHEQEKCDVREACQANLSELKKYISHFQEAQTLSPESVKELQKILSIPKSQRNGTLNDALFAQFLSYSKETSFSENISELVQKYTTMKEDFMKLSPKERKQKQPEGGKDGEWGQGTFKYLLIQESGKTTSVIEGPAKTSEDDALPPVQEELPLADTSVEPVPSVISLDKISGDQHPDAVEIFALGMTQEAFETEKTRLKASPEYAEAREIARSLKKSEIKNIQEATGAVVDGGFGVETYLYYLKSPLKTAGFSLQEVAKLEKIVGAEDASTIKTDITTAYGLPETALDEIFTEISAGDAFSYDTKLGQITLFDNETGKKATIDIAKGLYDTIESAFETGNKEEILTTLARITDDGPRGHYIDLIFQYIDEHNAYSQARNIFCEQKGDMLYMTDFAKNNDLILKFKAFHLFGDQEVLVSGGVNYFRVGEEFVSVDKKRLSVTQGTQIQLLDGGAKNILLDQHELRIRREELHTKMTDTSKLAEVLNTLDIKSILEYCSYSSPEEKRALVDKMKTLAFEKRMFASIRLMFCDIQGDTFTFKSFKDEPGVGNIFEKGLTAFDIFGDYMSINVGGTEYTARSSKKYGISIVNGSVVQLVEGTRRTEKDFEKLQDYPKLAEDFGKWVGKKRLGTPNGNCARGVADLCQNYGINVDRNHAREWDTLLDARVAKGQFIKVPINHPSEAKAGGILCYNEGSNLGTEARNTFGHVEIADGKGNYCYDGISSHPGGSADTKFKNREQYMKATKFTGYVYYPVRKT